MSERGGLRYVSEFRDAPACRALLGSLEEIAAGGPQLTFMEFCGGHTHAIARAGLRRLLPGNLRLLSGPGCPVCVTAQSEVDRAIAVASIPGIVLATFGDMMRVPGSEGSLLEARARGADVRVVYSPLDALKLAAADRDKRVVFLGVGFETTAPGVAAAMLQARRDGLDNFMVLSLHKLTPPAMRAIVDAGEVRLEGVIGPGHVTTIVGADAWRFLPEEYGIGCAVAGFEPADILLAVRELAAMCVAGEPRVSNCYPRSVSAAGNARAQALMADAFAIVEAPWRGLGVLPGSGLKPRPELAAHDAEARLDLPESTAIESPGCRCGEVLRGVVVPTECALFARACTPDSPVGPCMVSSEGTCAAYYEEGAGLE